MYFHWPVRTGGPSTFYIPHHIPTHHFMTGQAIDHISPRHTGAQYEFRAMPLSDVHEGTNVMPPAFPMMTPVTYSPCRPVLNRTRLHNCASGITHAYISSSPFSCCHCRSLRTKSYTSPPRTHITKCSWKSISSPSHTNNIQYF